MAALTTADSGAVANAPVSVWDIGRGGRPGGGAVGVIVSREFIVPSGYYFTDWSAAMVPRRRQICGGKRRARIPRVSALVARLLPPHHHKDPQRYLRKFEIKI